jgi:hypothetical protein
MSDGHHGNYHKDSGTNNNNNNNNTNGQIHYTDLTLASSWMTPQASPMLSSEYDVGVPPSPMQHHRTSDLNISLPPLPLELLSLSQKNILAHSGSTAGTFVTNGPNGNGTRSRVGTVGSVNDNRRDSLSIASLPPLPPSMWDLPERKRGSLRIPISPPPQTTGLHVGIPMNPSSAAAAIGGHDSRASLTLGRGALVSPSSSVPTTPSMSSMNHTSPPQAQTTGNTGYHYNNGNGRSLLRRSVFGAAAAAALTAAATMVTNAMSTSTTNHNNNNHNHNNNGSVGGTNASTSSSSPPVVVPISNHVGVGSGLVTSSTPKIGPLPIVASLPPIPGSLDDSAEHSVISNPNGLGTVKSRAGQSVAAAIAPVEPSTHEITARRTGSNKLYLHQWWDVWRHSPNHLFADDEDGAWWEAQIVSLVNAPTYQVVIFTFPALTLADQQRWVFPRFNAVADVWTKIAPHGKLTGAKGRPLRRTVPPEHDVGAYVLARNGSTGSLEEAVIVAVDLRHQLLRCTFLKRANTADMVHHICLYSALFSRSHYGCAVQWIESDGHSIMHLLAFSGPMAKLPAQRAWIQDLEPIVSDITQFRLEPYITRSRAGTQITLWVARYGTPQPRLTLTTSGATASSGGNLTSRLAQLLRLDTLSSDLYLHLVAFLGPSLANLATVNRALANTTNHALIPVRTARILRARIVLERRSRLQRMLYRHNICTVIFERLHAVVLPLLSLAILITTIFGIARVSSPDDWSLSTVMAPMATWCLFFLSCIALTAFAWLMDYQLRSTGGLTLTQALEHLRDPAKPLRAPSIWANQYTQLIDGNQEFMPLAALRRLFLPKIPSLPHSPSGCMGPFAGLLLSGGIAATIVFLITYFKLSSINNITSFGIPYCVYPLLVAWIIGATLYVMTETQPTPGMLFLFLLVYAPCVAFLFVSGSSFDRSGRQIIFGFFVYLVIVMGFGIVCNLCTRPTLCLSESGEKVGMRRLHTLCYIFGVVWISLIAVQYRSALTRDLVPWPCLLNMTSTTSIPYSVPYQSCAPATFGPHLPSYEANAALSGVLLVLEPYGGGCVTWNASQLAISTSSVALPDHVPFYILVNQQGCDFGEKVRQAMAAGASCVIVESSNEDLNSYSSTYTINSTIPLIQVPRSYARFLVKAAVAAKSSYQTPSSTSTGMGSSNHIINDDNEIVEHSLLASQRHDHTGDIDNGVNKGNGMQLQSDIPSAFITLKLNDAYPPFMVPSSWWSLMWPLIVIESFIVIWSWTWMITHLHEFGTALTLKPFTGITQDARFLDM